MNWWLNEGYVTQELSRTRSELKSMKDEIDRLKNIVSELEEKINVTGRK